VGPHLVSTCTRSSPHDGREALRELVPSAGLEVEAGVAGDTSSRLARSVTAASGPLSRFARLDSHWGWQLVAVARVPVDDTGDGPVGA
jgi:hypothetical protein